MKFLIDNALSSQIAIGLVEAGYDAIHVREIDMRSSPDIDILRSCTKEITQN
jgi:predicted nuclease of predicted toxin-antitoxin system